MCFLKIRRPPRSTRSDTLLPYTTLLRLIAPLSRLDCGAELHRLGRWPMHSASYRYSSNLSRGSRWRRAIALFLAVLVHALLLIMLLRQAPPPSRLLEPQPRPVTFQLSPEPQSTSKPASTAPKADTAHNAPPPPPAPSPPPPPPPPPRPRERRAREGKRREE